MVGKPWKPTCDFVLPFAREYVAKPGNNVGGNLHIVLDDCNLDDESILFCANQATEAGDEHGVALCGLLLAMSRKQRIKIADNVWRKETDNG